MNEEEGPPEALWQTTFVAVWAAVVLIVVFAAIRLRGPAPKPADAPPSEFSAVRARRILRQLLGQETPHPVGSEANRRVRQQVVVRLRALGYDPRLQRNWACGEWGACAQVENVIARLPGRESRGAVLLAAHYDSVPAGPGASDDGAGVAAFLEIARILEREAPLRNPLIFLIDDGEEPGLLGAEAFVRHHPWAREVAAVINLEARGTSGSSFMFETNRGNGWIIDLLSAVPRPSTSSLFISVYRQLPNDTDFTVFRRQGRQGVNFAYIGGVARYHTPLDTITNTSIRSLQHQGDNALAMARALGDLRLPPRRTGDATYFDVLQFGIIRWPERLDPLLLGIVIAFLIVAMALMVRSRTTAIGGIVWGALAALIAVVSSLAAAVGGRVLLKATGAFPADWVAHPAAAIAFFWLGPFAITTATAAALHRRAGQNGLWLGAAIWWVLFAALTTGTLPGASYLFLVPAAFFGAGGIAVALSKHRRVAPLAVATATVAAALLFAPLWLELYDVMGLGAIELVSLLVALVVATFAPAIAAAGRLRRWVPSAGAATALIALAIAVALPPYGRLTPRRLNITVHLDADQGGTTQILLSRGGGEIPEPMREAAAWRPREARPFPWRIDDGYFAADAPREDLPPPRLRVLGESTVGPRRVVRLALASERGAPRLALMLDDKGAVESIRAGRELAGWGPRSALRRRRGWAAGWTGVTLRGVPPEGVELELVLRSHGPVDGIVEDVSYGLPASVAPLLRARPSWAAPSGEGDTVVVTKRVRI